jgi:serine/threonine-protein kinase
MIQLRVLGGIGLRSSHGEELRAVLAQPKRLALLAHLALARPRGARRRDQIVAFFWPEQDSEHARNALSQAIFFLRRTLGPDTIVNRNAEEIELTPNALWCDAIAFEKAVDAGQYGEAVELYRGELLTGLHVPDVAQELEEWLDGERSRYAGLYAKALESLAVECEQRGDHRGASHWWRRLSSLDPYSSRLTLRLMQALFASGERVAAVRVAREHDALVTKELGIRPEPEIAALAERISSDASVVGQSSASPTASVEPVNPTESSAPTVPRPAAPLSIMRRSRTLTLAAAAAALLVLVVILVTSTTARSALVRQDRITAGLYSRGRNALLTRTPAALRQAIDFFQEAVERDSTFAPAYAGIAEAYGLASDLGYLPQAAANESSLVYVRRALAYNSNLSQAHTILAGSLSERGYFEDAEREFERAIELDPDNGMAHHWYAMLLATLHRGDSAMAENARAAKLDPMSASIRNAGHLIRAYFGAPERVDSAPKVDPTNAWARASVATILAQRGNCTTARQLIDRAAADVPNNPRMMLFQLSVSTSCGDTASARATLDAAKQLPQARVHGYYIAMGFRRLGEIDSMFVWLDSTHWNVQQRFNFRTNPGLDSLSRDSRYARVLQRMGLPPLPNGARRR